ncbi:ParA family protein [Vibrio hannami]|uniref:ParA family protein n=1 Tax=Vibrio hannami TaxID=2717094 RepID=UPI00240EAFDA|nr:ParA family protein [Vibrio hannami]MDG3089151.1 ParA family protein [Vibrio hannami]
MNIIAMANQKGGVGKTTSGVNLAAELARKHRVLFLDLDPQGNATELLCNGEKVFEFDETIASLFDKPKVTCLDDVIRPAMVEEDEIENLFVVPADFQLSRVIETSLTKINRERILEKHLAKMKFEADFVVLDTPPNLSLTTLNAIQASELVVVAVDSGKFSLNGVPPLLEAIEEIKDESDGYRILRNEVDSREKLINNFVGNQLKAIPDDRVFETIIRRDSNVGKANALSRPVRFYQPGSVVINDYRKAAKEIINYFM